MICDEIFEVLRDGQYHSFMELDKKLPFQPRKIRRAINFLKRFGFVKQYSGSGSPIVLVRLEDRVVEFLNEVDIIEHKRVCGASSEE